MRVCVTLSPGPAWRPGKPVPEQDRAIMMPHLELMLRYGREGRILFGGPFRSGFGGIIIFEAESEAEVVDAMNVDPTIVAGVMVFTVEAMRPVIDTLGSGRPAEG